MSRDEALALVERSISNRNLVKHSLAVEAIMRCLAVRLGEDAEFWGLVGLLHDVDYDLTAKDPTQHTLVGSRMLAEMGLREDLVRAVLVHNEAHGIPRETALDKALYCADALSGLVTAAGLIRPEKKLAPVEVDFIMRRFGEKSFARGANREQIRSCAEIGLGLEDFVGLGLVAMQAKADDLGL
ncbi:MAG: HDIG domain-containing protein [Chloroflexi bacterium]|nr:HDIG domain-containing protein [Chloroflexota bacterium]MCL5108137.1 HDIG domain-containing protein [Chloroflexota bacterium]